MNYIGYFKSLEGIDYSVKIITDDTSQEYKEVTLAGEDPVIVAYTENNRLYDPVRTSTCTVRIVCDEYLLDIYTGEAQGTKIIVEDLSSGLVRWCGYLQANMYSQGYSAPVEEIELEASDCLSSLQYFEYESDSNRVVDFKSVTDSIMTRCGLIQHYYITAKEMHDGNERSEMTLDKMYISERNFFSEEGEAWTLQEVLEETCKFFGYVCFQWGDSVYFIDYDKYTGTGMNGWRSDWNGTSWSTYSSVKITATGNAVTKDSYRGTGGTMSLDDIFNKIKVNCNYYNIENIIPDLFDEDLLTNRITNDEGYINVKKYGGRGNSELMYVTYYRIYDHKNIRNLYYKPDNDGETLAEVDDETKASEEIMTGYCGGNIIDIIHLDHSEANGEAGDVKNFEKCLIISQLNRPLGKWVDDEYNWPDYNFPVMEFKDLPPLVIEGSEETVRGKASTYLILNANATFTPWLKEPFINENDDKGMKWKVVDKRWEYMGFAAATYSYVDENPALTFYFSIDGKWWNGTSWQGEKTYFMAPLEKLDAKEDFWVTEKPIQNNTETNLFLGTGGYKITLPKGNLNTDNIYFAIGMPKRTAHLYWAGDWDDEIGQGYCFIKDIRLELARKNQALFEDTDTIYENVVNEGNVIEDEEVDIKITSDDGKNLSYSHVAVIRSDNVSTTNFLFYGIDGTAKKPEEAIVERYVNQYSTPSIKENITLDLSFLPVQLISDTYWQKNFVVTGQEINYQTDSQTITLLEKK